MTSPLAARTIRSPKSRLNSRLLTACGVSCMPARYAPNAGVARELCATLCAGFRNDTQPVAPPEGALIVGQVVGGGGRAERLQPSFHNEGAMGKDDPQNVYDDPRFFAGYAAMDRSRAEWGAAMEHESFLELLGDVAGLRVLDLGCGGGQLALHLAEAGAAEVVATDASERMLEVARTKRFTQARLLPAHDDGGSHLRACHVRRGGQLAGVALRPRLRGISRAHRAACVQVG